MPVPARVALSRASNASFIAANTACAPGSLRMTTASATCSSTPPATVRQGMSRRDSEIAQTRAMNTA